MEQRKKTVQATMKKRKVPTTQPAQPTTPARSSRTTFYGGGGGGASRSEASERNAEFSNFSSNLQAEVSHFFNFLKILILSFLRVQRVAS